MDLIYENWFARPFATVGVIDNIQVSTLNNPQVQFYSNNFDSLGRNAPTPVIVSNLTEGTAPLKVEFNGLSSHDNDGGNIKKYVWRFGDGDHTGNEKYGSNVNYTFTQPGVYHVNLIVYNDYGVPSDLADKTIIVKPANPNAYVFSGWIKDSYPGNISGRYVNQLLLDDNIILWQDDVAGNEGWQHVVVDLSPYVGSGQTHKVAFKLLAVAYNASQAGTDIVELYQWYDDITIFKTNIQNSNFEAVSVSPWKNKFTQAPGNPNPITIGTGVVTSDPRSGFKSFYMKFPEGIPVPQGTSAELYQNIVFQ
jgi:PKD repeat protein